MFAGGHASLGSETVVLGGLFESMAPCVLLAASDPERVRALVWWNAAPRTIWSPDYPCGWGPEEVSQELAPFEHWGALEYAMVWAEMPDRATGMRPSDAEILTVAEASRQTCTPDVELELARIWWDADVRPVLPEGVLFREGLPE
jgi:hypothetical protein